jgi:PAS domain S-box-containing protein/putative nucleotidyltransferase with HDIG domain
MGKKVKEPGNKKHDKAAEQHAPDKGGAGKAVHQLNFISTGEARYNELFNHMNSGVAVYEAVDGGEDFIFKDFNPAAEKIERVSRGEIIGRRVTEVFPSVKPFGLFAVFQRVWRSGKAEYFPDSIYRDDRDPGSWRESWVYRLQSGEVVAVYNDITERKLAEHSLRQSEIRMNSILAAMTELVFVLDDEGRFVSYHGSAQELYAGPDRFIGKKYSDVMPPHVNELAAGAIAKNRTGEASKFDYSLQLSAGPQHYAATMSPIIIDGKYNGSVLVARNITERQQSIEALSASEEKYRSLVENINDVLYTLDNEGRITYVSPAVERFTKYTVADLVGQPFTPMIYPDDLPGLLASYDKILSGRLEPWEFRVLDKDGRVIWVRSSSLPIYEEGKIVGVRALMTDITAPKLVEQSLSESEERFRNMANLLPQTIYETDEKGNFTFINSQGLNICGYTEADIAAGVNFLQAVHPGDHDRAIENVKRRLSEDHAAPHEYTAVTRDGRTFPALIYASPILKGAANVGMRGMMIDVTERKQMEQALKDSLDRLHKTLNDTVVTMGAIVEMKDPYTAGHQLQVARLAAAIAQEMGLPESQVNIIRTTAAIHDIGKIYIPSDILSKPGKLGTLELSIIRTHAQGSYDILKNIDFGGPVAQIALQHHERMDGSGYPHGLKGEEIVIEARIMAVADVVEAIASHRPYRPALGIDKALEEIRQNRGTHYDPDVVDACLKIFDVDGFKLD